MFRSKHKGSLCALEMQAENRLMAGVGEEEGEGEMTGESSTEVHT